MEEQILIQVRFKEQTPFGEYNDALYFTQEDYDIISKEDLLKLKTDRIQNWIDIVSNPPIKNEPTKTDLEAEKIDLQQKIDDINAKIASIDQK